MFSRGHHSYVIRYLRLSCVISYQAHGHVLLSRVLSCLSVSCPAFHCPVLPFTVSAPSKCPVNNCPVLQKCPVLPSVLSCSVFCLSYLVFCLSYPVSCPIQCLALSSVQSYPEVRKRKVLSVSFRLSVLSSQCPVLSVFCPSLLSVLSCPAQCPVLPSILSCSVPCPAQCPALSWLVSCPVLLSALPCPG